MVFYRKYRPQTIAELDSEAVREKLLSVLSSKSIPHAFLFTGPKGLGKTSTARIVAKALNCEKKATGTVEPCNKCDQCVSITNGTNFDVLEIDGASNRGIDEIRDLREKVKLAPISSVKKVYIIDEVHMLTNEAFNALLKTIEEPPEHVVFIFCTTEPHKVPDTILSRCFHIAFKKATISELVHSFERIAKGEKLTVDRDVFGEVAKLSDGGFRDGTKLLEELSIAAKDGKITKELLETKYNSSSVTQGIHKLLVSLKSKDSKKAFEAIETMASSGIEFRFVTEELLKRLHMLTLSKVGLSENGEKDEELDFSIEEILKLVELFSKAHQEIKYAVIPQLPLEIAVVEWGGAGKPTQITHRNEGDSTE